MNYFTFFLHFPIVPVYLPVHCSAAKLNAERRTRRELDVKEGLRYAGEGRSCEPPVLVKPGAIGELTRYEVSVDIG